MLKALSLRTELDHINLIDIIILIFAVIGFIVNAVKRSRTPPPASRPPSAARPQPTPPGEGRQAPQRTSPAARPGGTAVISASNRPLAGAPAGSKIVSQAPMSGVAQQFAQERAASDRQMAAAADQARSGDSGGSGGAAQIDNPFFDTSAANSREIESYKGSMSNGVLNLRRFKGRDNVLNGLIFAQILTPPLCKGGQKPVRIANALPEKNKATET